MLSNVQRLQTVPKMVGHEDQEPHSIPYDLLSIDFLVLLVIYNPFGSRRSKFVLWTSGSIK